MQYLFGCSMSSTLAVSRSSLVMFRGLVWAIIGLIYAPLFTALLILFEAMGFGHWSYGPAGAIAGAVGAAFYSAWELALVGTLIGLVAASLLFMILPGTVAFWQVALVAALAATLMDRLTRFPDRCVLQAPRKALTGLLSGLSCGGLLGAVESLHPFTFTVIAVVAFMVSVNGIIYSAALSWWLRQPLAKGSWRCQVIESLVIGMVATVAAGSLWVFGGPLIGAIDGSHYAFLNTLQALMPGAMFGGAAAGAVTGALLEAFDFDWAI